MLRPYRAGPRLVGLKPTQAGPLPGLAQAAR